MAVCSFAMQSCQAQHDPLGLHSLWTQRSGLGRAPDDLISWNKPLANYEAANSSTFTGRTSRPVGRMAGPGSSVGSILEVLYLQLAPLDTYNDSGRPAGSVIAETVSKLCRQGQLTEAVDALGVLVHTESHISKSLFYTVFKECVAKKDLCLGRRVHALVVKRGYESDTFLCNHILRMYASHAMLQEALDVFAMVSKPNAFTWSAMISALVKHGQDRQAVQLYRRMRRSSVKPDGHVFVAALQACARGADLESGQQVHADIMATGVEPDLFVCRCLVDMYAKCGSLEEAQRVFDGLPKRDVVTWNAMIAGYAQKGMGLESLRLYSCMQEEGMTAPSSVTFVCLLQACASVGTQVLEQGKQLHAQIKERGLEADVVVGGSLVNMYAKCGSLEDARGVFNGLGQKNVVTWNTMIARYSQQNIGHEALGLYRAMQEEGIVALDSVTFVCLLHACESVAALQLGRQLHAQIKDQGLQADTTVGNSLINMYAKLGTMVDTQQVFDVLPERNILTWSALIAGYARQGDGGVVFDLVLRMAKAGIQPDGVTFLSVLTVCSHTGQVTKGRQYFEAMSKHYGITPTVDHYTCMVDLLGRAGRLEEALGFVKTMPVRPDAAVWHTLLGSCRKWTNVEVGRHAFDAAVKLDKQDASAYILMSNIYTGAQMWEQAEEMQARRVALGARKQPGQSWWTDMDGLVHSFFSWG